MKRTTTVVILLAFSSLMSACSANQQSTDPLVYGLTLAPSGLDPHINASAELGIPLSSVYDTLVFQDPETGAFVPGLAKDWQISSDGLSYTFQLRDDVHFHDGTPFNAQAVAENIAYITNPEHRSQKAVFMLGPFERVEVVDDYTVTLHLSQPYAPLLDSLAQVYLGMASPAALEEWGPAEYQFHQVGTGPYRFVEYIPNDHLTLERNQDYGWAPAVYAQTEAAIEQIRFQFYEDPATRAFALESGEADVLGEIPPREAQRLDQMQEFSLHPVPIPGQPLQFFYNLQRAPTDDLRVRQALTMAVNRPQIVDTIFGPYSPVSQAPISASTFGYSDAYPYPAHDAEAASALLEQAGWLLEPGERVRRRAGESLMLELVAPPWGSNPEVAQLIAAAWQEVGAEVNLQVAPGFGPLKEAQVAGSYHAIGINFFGRDPDLLHSFYHSQGLYNWSQVENPTLDSLLDSAREQTLDPSSRMDLYAQAFQIIRDQALLLPVRDYVNLVIAQQEVHNMRFSSQGWFPFLIDLQWAP